MIDIIIIIFIAFGGFVGFKRGIIKETVKAIGLFAITIVSFILKNNLSVLLYQNLPFFKFGGIFKGITVLNIAVYEIIAFLVVFLILAIIWKVISIITNLAQKIINATIVLGLPSKILGAIIGIIEFYLIAFIVLYIASLPVFNLKPLEQSKYKNAMLTNTPVLSGYVDSTVKVVDEFTSLKEKYQNAQDANQFNYETLDIFLKYKIVTPSSVKKLVEKEKLDIKGIEKLIEKYEE